MRRPKVLPVVWASLLFGVFGLRDARRRGRRAKALGFSQSPYWIAWAATTSATLVVLLVVLRTGF